MFKKIFVFTAIAANLFTVLLLFLHTTQAFAQSAISLSVSPPLFELMIQPGKEAKQTYTVINNGGDTMVTPQIVYFDPSGEDGAVNLTDNPAPDWIKYSKEPIKLKGGDKIDFNLIFSPPENTEETDHFLTLIFETKEPVDILNQNSTKYTSQIGTNILITISKDGNPKKSAEIIEFSAPKIIDSFLSPVIYNLTISNNGNSFWKPMGKIVVGDEILKLTPQNILSGSSRKISCLDDENLISCKLKNKFRIGKIVSKLEFSIDEDPKIYKSEATTIAIPFSIVGLIFTLLTTTKYGLTLNPWKRRK